MQTLGNVSVFSVFEILELQIKDCGPVWTFGNYFSSICIL